MFEICPISRKSSLRDVGYAEELERRRPTDDFPEPRSRSSVRIRQVPTAQRNAQNTWAIRHAVLFSLGGPAAAHEKSGKDGQTRYGAGGPSAAR